MDYPIARTGLWARASALLVALALMAALCWWAWHARTDPQATGAAGRVLVVGALVAAIVALASSWWARLRQVQQRLRWDGAAWHLCVPGREPLQISPPSVRVDLGMAMLLWALPRQGGGARWLALQRADLPAAWHGLRVALLQASPAATLAPGGSQ